MSRIYLICGGTYVICLNTPNWLPSLGPLLIGEEDMLGFNVC